MDGKVAAVMSAGDVCAVKGSRKAPSVLDHLLMACPEKLGFSLFGKTYSCQL